MVQYWTMKSFERKFIHRTHLSATAEVKDFSRLYNRKAHVHHYTEYMEKGEFDEAFETVNTLIKDYISLDMLQLCIANRVTSVSFAGVVFFFVEGSWPMYWGMKRQLPAVACSVLWLWAWSQTSSWKWIVVSCCMLFPSQDAEKPVNASSNPCILPNSNMFFSRSSAFRPKSAECFVCADALFLDEWLSRNRVLMSFTYLEL